jgi:hypothetical protein
MDFRDLTEGVAAERLFVVFANGHREGYEDLRVYASRGLKEIPRVIDGEYVSIDIRSALNLVSLEGVGKQSEGHSVEVYVGNTHRSTIKTGDISVSGGTLAVAGLIQESFNTVQASNAPTELKQSLDALNTLVAELVKKLPAPAAEVAARDLEALNKEAVSSAPRRQWYELSASGLKDAAKAVAGMAAPIATAVKEVVELLSSSTAT